MRQAGCPTEVERGGNLAGHRGDSGNEKPEKERSTEKIDAIVAAIMAVGRMQAGSQGARSVYETRELLVI